MPIDSMPHLSPLRCRIRPYWIKAAPHGGAAGPASSAQGSALGGPPGTHTGPPTGGTLIKVAHRETGQVLRGSVFLAADCPAHGHRV
jgi:hypothetical protein